MDKRLYNGLHLHHALYCLRIGNERGAISWMWKDISEIYDEKEIPAFGTIKEEIDGISYYSVCDQYCGVNGEAI